MDAADLLKLYSRAKSLGAPTFTRPEGTPNVIPLLERHQTPLNWIKIGLYSPRNCLASVDEDGRGK